MLRGSACSSSLHLLNRGCLSGVGLGDANDSARWRGPRLIDCRGAGYPVWPLIPSCHGQLMNRQQTPSTETQSESLTLVAKTTLLQVLKWSIADHLTNRVGVRCKPRVYSSQARGRHLDLDIHFGVSHQAQVTMHQCRISRYLGHHIHIRYMEVLLMPNALQPSAENHAFDERPTPWKAERYKTDDT